MFNRAILALNDAAQRLPASALLSALLVTTAVPVTQAASINTSDDWANPSINPAAYCDSDIDIKVKAPTAHPKYQSSQRRAMEMDDMIAQLRVYQQNNKSARQQYLAYKAQAWLDYADHEDITHEDTILEGTNKSKPTAGSHALQSGTTILQALQNDTAEQLSITMDIPTTSALMRPDLWATLQALKVSGGISAAPRELAFSEVALIWAAADQCKHGRRQSGAHFRMADRWLERAREAYVNTHDSQTNVALGELINRYFKQYAPLDSGNDSCRGQVLPMSTQTLHTEINRTLSFAQTVTIPMPTPTATYRLVY